VHLFNAFSKKKIKAGYQGSDSQHFIFFLSCEWSNKLEFLSLASLSSHSLMGPFVSKEESKVL
jgi:hypothetical protein